MRRPGTIADPPACRRTAPAPQRTAFTLMELLIAMAISSLVTVTVGGITLAVRSAWEHSQSIEEVTAQGSAALQRVDLLVSRIGRYRTATGVVAGMAVVEHRPGVVPMPDTLVLWTGGRDGDFSGQGTIDRLPRADELLVITPDPTDAQRLVEIAFPNDPAEIDFEAADFESRIRTLIESPQATAILLSDRLRPSPLRLLRGGTAEVGNVRFELRETPSAAQIADADTPAKWQALPWVQGVSATTTGLRQSTLRIELQLLPRHMSLHRESASAAFPFFGSSAYRYLYEAGS